LTLAATLGMSMAAAAPVAAAATVHHVTMTGFPTNPAFCVEGNCGNHSVTIAPGDTVVWTYSDGTCDLSAVCPGHTASSTSGPASFGSPTMYGPRLLNPSGPTTYALSFSAPGTYKYMCAFHGTGPSGGAMHMDGVVVVAGGGAQGAQSSGNPIVVPPGSSSASGPGAGSGSSSNFPLATSNSVPSDELPNTFVPGLPVAGRGVGMPATIILAAVALLATLPAALLLTVRLAARRS
jgi:plastocyanin